MNFEVGKHYKTRSGRKVLYLYTLPSELHAEKNFYSRAAFYFTDTGTTFHISESGKLDPNSDDEWDVVDVWTESEPRHLNPRHFPPGTILKNANWDDGCYIHILHVDFVCITLVDNKGIRNIDFSSFGGPDKDAYLFKRPTDDDWKTVQQLLEE